MMNFKINSQIAAFAKMDAFKFDVILSSRGGEWTQTMHKQN